MRHRLTQALCAQLAHQPGPAEAGRLCWALSLIKRRHLTLRSSGTLRLRLAPLIYSVSRHSGVYPLSKAPAGENDL